MTALVRVSSMKDKRVNVLAQEVQSRIADIYSFIDKLEEQLQSIEELCQEIGVLAVTK